MVRYSSGRLDGNIGLLDGNMSLEFKRFEVSFNHQVTGAFVNNRRGPERSFDVLMQGLDVARQTVRIIGR